MMKKLIAIFLCVFITVTTLGTTGVFALEASEIPDEAEVVDVADSAADDVSGSYILTDDGDPVLEVKYINAPGLTAALNDTAANGYYTAEFMLPETNYRVFLTGLTQDSAEEIKQAIIESYTEGGDFDLKNLGFIDAEKTWPDDGDENLCWAASTSNLLTYTGWAAQAGFNSTDDLFEAFISAFTDAGGNIYYGAGWFFNGVSAPGGAQPTAGTGKYLPQYSFVDKVEQFDLYEGCAADMGTVYDKLREGYGVSLSVDVYGSEGYEGGHAVTCWGFVTDIRHPETSREFYKNIFITDSDSHKYWVQEGMDRRDADDVMSLFALDPVEQEGIDTYSFQITDQQIALITEAYTLAPYSNDIPYEIDSTATLDLVNSPDIIIDPFVLTDDANDDDTTKTVFAPNSTIYFHPYMMNVSSVAYSGPLYMTITVKDAQGNTVYSRNFNYSSTATIDPSSGSAFNKTSITPKLGVGDYTITASFNPNHNRTEAYYYNNVKTISFKVRESYLIGDADESGEVDTIDTTIIQRYLARMDVEVVDGFDQRADVTQDGMADLMDVTYLQRYLANMDVPYDVNASRFYD